MILDIVLYPNSLLRSKSKLVEKFDSSLHELLDNMYETMIANNGIGLAAIQVGIPLRALIVNLFREEEQNKEDLIEIINPEILNKSGEIIWQEGCLSLPGFYNDVKRSNEIELEYLDRFGNSRKIEAQELLAVALQHEIDHLDGVLFIDKLNIIERKRIEKELRKNKKCKA